MKENLPLPEDKKLVVVCRVEAGCLGAKGGDHIEAFCHFAQKEYAALGSDYIRWEIVPRHDKSLPEMQYRVNEKKISRDQAAKYLNVFKKKLGEFEDHMHDKLGGLIEQYLGRI
ncbi:MAG: hypothetical protein L3J28_10520 [Candidatus Polarisedimenticolaceae bacterium]|nr:hypothetical protein [Candidatus Polarisedimenticolaceae bacterium]